MVYACPAASRACVSDASAWSHVATSPRNSSARVDSLTAISSPKSLYTRCTSRRHSSTSDAICDSITKQWRLLVIPDRHVLVAADLATEDQHVARAVHRLQGHLLALVRALDLKHVLPVVLPVT